ncbi:MAG: hypothetical protein ABGZ53_34080 [Fuerstiella sp.]
MNIYSTKNRFVLSVASTIALAGVYVVFRLLTSPFLEVERAKRTFTQLQTGDDEPEFRRIASKWFPLDQWVSKSAMHFRHGGRYVYFQKYDLMDGPKQSPAVDFRPIAMLWNSESEDVPIRLVAKSAQLRHSKRFSLLDMDLGRITGGRLAGGVRLRGPRGLKISVPTLHLSEDSMKLWSSDRVDFAWEGHTGHASSGIDIYLQSDSGDGLANVTNISEIVLNGRVDCDFSLPGQRAGDEELKLKISAAKGFKYDFTTMTGVFQGISAHSETQSSTSDRPIKRDEEVWVRRFNADSTVDQMVCPELKLQFRNEFPNESGMPADDRLHLENMTAWGKQVAFYSQEHNLTVLANNLHYAVDRRLIEISNTKVDHTGRQYFVDVRQDGSHLKVPRIRILHDTDGSIRRVECLGTGKLSAQPPSPSSDQQEVAAAGRQKPRGAFTATWRQSMTLQLGEDGRTRIVTLKEGASVAQPEAGFKLSADAIAMRLAETGVSSNADEHSTLPAGVVGPVSKPTSDSAFDLGSLRPEVLTATENVVLISPDTSGRLRERLTVRFEHMIRRTSDENEPSGGVKTVAQTRPAKPELPSNADSATSKARVAFVSDTLDAIVMMSEESDNREVEFHNLWLKGSVQVVRHAQKAEDSFTASGNQLYAAQGLNDNREVQLFGDPATVERLTETLEGPRIDLNELSGQAKVVGSGRIRFVSDTGFDGLPLLQPTPIDIFWSDHMEFQNRRAHFVGNIRVIMSDGKTQHMEVTCSGLDVYFDRDIALGQQTSEGSFLAVQSGDEDSSASGPIERIECHSHVVVKIEQFAKGVTSARHNAEFADLSINLKTGDFNAIGRGFLSSMSPDRNGQLQGSSPATARANTPAQTHETAFVFMKAEFIGEIRGNLHRQEATLSHHVEAVVAPARRVDEKINFDHVATAQLPERAGILSAEELTISAVPLAESESDSFAIVARENARLESQTISGTADVITYDHSKEQFILRAEGRGSVTVNHRVSIDSPFNKLVGKRFEYHRRTNKLNAEEIRSLEVGE